MIVFHPVGVIHSPYRKLEGMPIQPCSAVGAEGAVEMFPEYHAGLKDLDGFSHIFLLYHFHAGCGFSLQVTPFLDTEPRGLFATRAPKRPNSIGLSIVKLTKIEGGRLSIMDVDILDGTPLLDIKPYVPEFDHRTDVRIGWLAKAKNLMADTKADGRFR